MRKSIYILLFITISYTASAQGIQDYGFNSAEEISDTLKALKEGDQFRTNITGYFVEYFWLLSLRAMEYTRTKKYEEALVDYNEILAYDSTDQTALLNKAKVLFNSRKMEEAVFVFDQAIALDPSNADIWRFKSMALKVLGRKEESDAAKKKFKELRAK